MGLSKHDDKFLLSIVVFASPALAGLSVNPSKSVTTPAMFLHLRVLCKDLQEIKLSGLNCDPSSMLTNFPQLCVVHYWNPTTTSEPTSGSIPSPTLDVASIMTLASLPHLRDLKIDWCLDTSSGLREMLSLIPQDPFFPALQA